MGRFTNSGGGTGEVTIAHVQDSTHTYAADAEASDSYAITLSTAPSAYATGQLFHFKANTANTGAATLNVNSLGAKTIKKQHDTDLADNDIESGSIVTVIYDGTNFQMTSQSANAAAGGTADGPGYLFGPEVAKDSAPRYMTPPNSYSAATLTMGADYIYYQPTHMPAYTYTRIGVEVTTAVSSTIRLGIYGLDATTGGPGALILDAGTVDASTTGNKEITISQALDAGPVWIAAIADASPGVRATNPTLADSMLGLTSPSASETTYVYKTSSSGEHTSLSSTALSTLTDGTSNSLRAWLRVV